MMYQMGVYCRLSKDDGENKVSESIENQMKLIREYVSKSDDLEIADIYIDDEDGWTVYTEDGKPSAQWEVTLAVTEDGYEILTY